MNPSRAKHLIIILTVVIIMSALTLGALHWLPHPETSPLPTIMPTAELPLPTQIIASPAEDTLPPHPTETPVMPQVISTQTAVPTSTFVFISTETAVVTTIPFTHTVQSGETLSTIADTYNLDIADIVAVNQLADPNNIYPDQILNIPANNLTQFGTQPTVEPTGTLITTAVSTPLPPLLHQPDWPPSLTGDSAADNYPLTTDTVSGQITLHYQPNTYPNQHIRDLSQTIDASWADIQSQLGKPFPRRIDVYLAGTLFAINPALQGLTQSWDYRSFILVNGAFDPGEEQYILAHELTHIAATHLLGPTSSTMLHEGLAVHLPQAYLTQQAGYLPHTEICAAILDAPEFKTAVRMNEFSYSPNGFGGHISTYFHYNLAGCFVTYLIETYGLEKFDWVYETSDYEGIYGRSLAQLDQEWQAWLTAVPVTVDPTQFINSVNNVAAAYEDYVAASAGGVHANWDAYLHLNHARLAANQGNFAEAETELAAFYTLFSPEIQ